MKIDDLKKATALSKEYLDKQDHLKVWMDQGITYAIAFPGLMRTESVLIDKQHVIAELEKQIKELVIQLKKLGVVFE